VCAAPVAAGGNEWRVADTEISCRMDVLRLVSDTAALREKRRRAAAVQDAGANFCDFRQREASWSAPALWRFRSEPDCQPRSPRRLVAPKSDEGGSLMGAEAKADNPGLCDGIPLGLDWSATVCAAPVAAGGNGRRVVDTEITRRVDMLRLGLRPYPRSGEKRRRAAAVQDAGANFCDFRQREAFWSAPALWRFRVANPCARNGEATAPAPIPFSGWGWNGFGRTLCAERLGVRWQSGPAAPKQSEGGSDDTAFGRRTSFGISIRLVRAKAAWRFASRRSPRHAGANFCDTRYAKQRVNPCAAATMQPFRVDDFFGGPVAP
jgi:hypothetical protein